MLSPPSSPKTVTTSPTFASGTRVISTMHMSMQMRPTCGTRLPCSRNDTLLERLRGKPSA